MEEPKVLYLPNDSSHPAGKRCLNLSKLSDNDIEYIRKDAFIEKAAGWLDKILRDTDFYENEIVLLLKEFKKAMSEKCNESNHVFIKGDVIKNKVTEKQYLVIKVEGNTFLLGDAICPQFGYKKEVTISPLYVFVKHLSEKEFKDIMNRCL